MGTAATQRTVASLGFQGVLWRPCKRPGHGKFLVAPKPWAKTLTGAQRCCCNNLWTKSVRCEQTASFWLLPSLGRRLLQERKDAAATICGRKVFDVSKRQVSGCSQALGEDSYRSAKMLLQQFVDEKCSM